MNNKAIAISFGKAIVSDGIIEVIIQEGHTFNAEHLKELFELFDSFSPNKKFGYLSNRVNPYSIDLSPSLYRAFHENLVATAAVCYTDLSYKTAQFEKKFYENKPFRVFKEYEEARQWLKTFL